MLCLAAAALACLCLARASPADSHNLRVRQTPHKDLNYVLASIEERLRILDTISMVQMKQTRRLDVIQDKLDRMETALTLKLERAQLAAERLEHRLHMLETHVHASIKEHSEKIERSQIKLTDIARNMSTHIDTHTQLLDKANGAYADTWRRGLVLESLMRDGLSLINVTRRELADGLRALARRTREARFNSADLEANFARRLNDNTYKIDLKMQEVLDAQKHFMDSCQRVQLDDPNHVADVLDKLIDSLINKTASTFHELQNIQVTMRNHDTKVMKLLSSGRASPNDAACRRIESAFRNISHSNLKETELQQLTEKFIALTDRADAALQKLEVRLRDDNEGAASGSDVTAAADRLFLKLKGIRNEEPFDSNSWEDEQEDTYFDDGGGGDMMQEDREILTGIKRQKRTDSTNRPPHRRHLHKHPYDRGPRHGRN